MRGIVTSFEDLIDGVFDDTVGVLQDAQRDVSALINSPIEILKDAFETMASTRVDDAYTYVEDQIEKLREILDRVRTPILDETGFLPFSYSQADLTAIKQLQ